MGKKNPDWSLLPAELLQMISEKVMSISNFVCFRAVCNTWRSASWPRPRHLPPQLPWLILPRGPDEESNHGSMLSVYDISQSRTHILDLPEIKDKRICGSSNGWLILENVMLEFPNVCFGQKVWLFNPITRDQISLPSLCADPNLFINLTEGNSDNYYLDPPMELHIIKAILSSNPGTDPDCLVMALFVGSWELAFCRIGDERWTVIAKFEEYVYVEDVLDIGYHNGLLYAFNSNGGVRICDIRSPSYKVINPDIEFGHLCPVERGCDEHGLILLRWHCMDLCNPITMNPILMWSEKQECWLDAVEECLSSHIFFLGFGRRFDCMSLPVANMKLEGWGGNCMCYISRQLVRIDDEDRYSFSINLFGLNNNSERTLASHVGSFDLAMNEFNSPKRPSFFWLAPTLC